MIEKLNSEKTGEIVNICKSVFCTIALLLIVVFEIYYVNGGIEYEHLIYFRYVCILFGAMLLVLMVPAKLGELINPWNLIYIGYVPLCYLTTHYIYENEWIVERIDPYAFYYLDVKFLAKTVVLIFGLLIIAVIKDFILKDGYKRMKNMNPVMLIIWLAYITALIIFHNKYTYNWFIIICFTLAIYVLGMEGIKEHFFNGVKYGFVLAFLFICYKSLRHRPYDTERYMSYFVNSNIAGTFLASVNVVLFTIIYDIWRKEKSLKKNIWLAIYLFIFGISVTMTIFNYTRTTIMGMGASVIFLVIIRFIRKEDMKDNLKRVAVLVLTAVIMFYPVYLAMRYIPALFNEPTFLAWEYDEVNRVHKEDPIDSPKYTGIDDFLTLALGKWGIYVDFDADKNSEDGGEAVVIDTERDVTNGRTDTWKLYLEHIGPFGHYPAHIVKGHTPIYEDKGLYQYVYYSEEDLYDEANLIYHAHDTYLHMAYLHGIIFAIFYILLCGATFIFAAVNVIKSDDKDIVQNVFAFLIICVSVFSQITESIVHPALILCMMMYISIMFTTTYRKTAEKKAE